MIPRLTSLLVCCWLLSCSCAATKEDDPQPEDPTTNTSKVKVVNTKTELQAAINSAKPGDTIALANGEWKDASFIFEAKGTNAAPIVLTAETKGQVTLSGQSDVRMAGEHLVLSGLVFKNGYAPTKTVISFRKNTSTFAHNSRVTECVIVDYNRPDGTDEKWISIYGSNNRVDHNYLEGKTSVGTTLVVWLDDVKSRENNNRIDHNFFGHRPPLGKNGAETIRIGTSETSMHNSNTTVENNYFYRCDGEAEIISIKSAQNVIQKNVFFESKGSVVMRHGNNNVVKENFFIGNKVKETGGIRIINQGHQVYNNHLQELAGTSNKSSLVIMRGIVNSPLNGYHQVIDVTVKDNAFFYSTTWQLGTGSEPGQTLLPENTLLKNNLYFNPTVNIIYNMPQPIPGMTFTDNKFKLAPASTFQATGFSTSTEEYEKGSNGIYKKQGAPDVTLPVTQATTGPAWYQ